MDSGVGYRLPLLWANGDFDHAFATIAGEFVGFGDAVEREGVGQEWAEVETAVANEFHEAAHALFAAWAEQA